MTRFVSVIGEDESAAALQALCGAPARGDAVWDVRAEELRSIPRSPFCYWAPTSARSAFTSLSALRTASRDCRVGLQSSDDFRWLRLWWAVPPSNRHTPYAKGGAFSPFYSDLNLVVDWLDDGRAMVTSKLERLRRGEITANNSKNWNSDFYGRKGLTWPSRTDRLSVRVLPPESIIGNKGPGLFDDEASDAELLALLGVTNSGPFRFLMELQVSRVELAKNFDAGLLRAVPLPALVQQTSARLGQLAARGWSLKRSLDASVGVSHAFVVPAVLQVEGETFAERVDGWASRVAGTEAELAGVQAEIDELCFGLYGISEEDRRAITKGFGVDDDAEDSGGDDEADDSGDLVLDPVGLGSGLVSWAVGVGVGRFDVRLATGEREWPVEPDPFDPLPVCSPGMLTGDDGLPLETPPEGYPVEISPVLVDDPGHELDITARVRSVFDVVFGDDADGWWVDVGVALGTRSGEVGSWLSKGFFDHHLKTHSKSRRKAPILWPLGTSSGSYTVWLYAHRATGDSLHRVLNDVVVPKLGVEQRRLSELVQEAGPEPSAAQRRAIDRQETLVGELAEFRGDIEAVLPLWHPDLNDGIVIVLAPLWRLFAHHRAWSKELKKHWDKLAAGDYDWAQLAMSLWPERVVPKCAEDRSLAISHGLEDVFWVQDDTNPDKWHARETPITPIEDLITERTNPTTNAALQEVAS